MSERGRRLAIELGERHTRDGIAVVFTSDLGRAVETAEIAFAGTGTTIIRDARLARMQLRPVERHAGRTGGGEPSAPHRRPLPRRRELPPGS
ncbi:MAG: histidine phosphatase family protein [Ktedonobacterales bacterium]